METSTQENLAAAQEQTDYAAETFKATSSISKKMEAVIEGIFEYLYTELKSILEGFNEFMVLFSKRKTGKELDNKLVAGKNEGNAKLVDAMLKAGKNEENLYDKRAKWIGTVGPAFKQGMDEAIAGQKKAIYDAAKADKEKANGGKALKGADLEAFNKEFEKTFSGLSIQNRVGPKMMDAFRDIFARGFTDKDGLGLDKDRVKEAVDMDKSIDEKKRKAFNDAIDATGSVDKAFEAAGFNEDDMEKLMSKSLWGLSPEEFAKVVPGMDLLKGKGPAKVYESTNAAKKEAAEAETAKAKEGGKSTAPGAPVPTSSTGQTASTAKSATPGNAGAVTATSDKPLDPGLHFSPDLGPMSYENGPMMTSTPDKGTQEVINTLDFTGKDTVRGLQDLWDLMKQKGIRLNPQKFQEDTKIEKSVLAALRVALFEFAVYTAADPNKVLAQMEASGLDAGKQAGAFKEAKGYKEGFLRNDAKKNAEGGLVTSVAGGLAQVNPAPGEGLASIGKGERIIPAGAGGGAGNITVNVNGIGGADLANLIKAKVAEGVYEYKRREKFH
jgi:hypothetical protein